MGATRIEWCDDTHNPIVGCQKCSPGCDNCYAERMAKRLRAMGHIQYQGVVDENGWTGKSGVSLEMFANMCAGKKRRVKFIGSMTDMFRDLPAFEADWRDRAMYAVASAPQHIFIMLTKRSKLASDYLDMHGQPPNLWVGVSVCSNADDFGAVSDFLDADRRFVSFEPLLEEIRPACGGPTFSPRGALQYADWFIVGGENGPGARRMGHNWPYYLRDYAGDWNIPFFFKGYGGTTKRTTPRTPNDLNIREYPEGMRVKEAPNADD